MISSVSCSYIMLLFGEYRSSLMLAAMNGHTDAILSLLYAGANINSVDISGHSALHFAVCL